MNKGFAYTGTIAIIAFALLGMVIYSNIGVQEQKKIFKLSQRIYEIKLLSENMRIVSDRAFAEALADYVIDQNYLSGSCSTNVSAASSKVQEYLERVFLEEKTSQAGAPKCEIENLNYSGDASGNASVTLKVKCSFVISNAYAKEKILSIEYEKDFKFEKSVSANYSGGKCNVSIKDRQADVVELTQSG